MRRGWQALAGLALGLAGLALVAETGARARAQAPAVPEWQDPGIVGVDKLAPRAHFTAFADPKRTSR